MRELALVLAALTVVGCHSATDRPVDRPAFLNVKPYTEHGCTHEQVVERCDNGFCRIPAGCFVMGSPADEYGRGLLDEEPLKVTFSHSFEILKFETTQRDWVAQGFSNPSTTKPDRADAADPNAPVGNVTWYDALAYANALSKAHSPALPECYKLVDCKGRPGEGFTCPTVELTTPTLYECLGYRLPTEGEWEYAARAGTRTAYYSGGITPQKEEGGCPPEPNLDAIAWYCKNSDAHTHPVGGKTPNAWGLHDMLGNAFEWVHDGLNDWTKLPTTEATDPVGFLAFDEASTRIFRGGGLNAWSALLRASNRNYSPAQGSDVGLSFRVVRTLPADDH